MSLIILIIILILLTSQKNIRNGGYNIVSNDFYLYYNRRKIYLTEEFNSNTLFRIIKINGNFNNTIYHIEDYESKYRLSISNNGELIFRKNTNNQLWNFKESENNSFIISNLQNCSLIINNLNIFCKNVSDDEATKFNLIKIFNAISANLKSINKKILNNEPIDILIKYIDLRDPNLLRNGIHQISKDYDNEELRYSLRSILINIPWVRKIFILMPNDKVRFLKDYNLINEKIIYVKDKDMLGFDSSNSNAFQFRYWNMRKFGISDNIIIMDDDCFINKKLEKSDFFYVNKGKVYPLIVTSNFIKINKNDIQKKRDLYKKRVENIKEEQGRDDFFYSKYQTYSFLLDSFNISDNQNIFIPAFTHNAIPINLNDAKEIYNLIYNSIYKYNTLDCLFRISGYIQFQTFILAYTFIKYNRKVNNIPNIYIELNNSISVNYNAALFCINKGPGVFNFLNFYKSRLTLEYLFPTPTKYEIIDYSILNLSFNIVYTMQVEINQYEKQIIKLKVQKNYYLNLFFLINILIFFKFNYYNIYSIFF